MEPLQTEAAAVPILTLADVFRIGVPIHAKTHSLPVHHWKVLRAIMACRTPVLGGHLYQCIRCGKEHFVPHSCRNRHCPTCQGANGFDWMEKQAEALLPIPYFHLVFTLPHNLNPLVQQNQSRLYTLLFDTVSETLLEFGRNNLQAQIGVTSVLHTWSQTLLDHYHLHCIVTGGGLRLDGKGWKATSNHWLFPVRALSKVFRGKFCDGLQKLYATGQLEFHGQITPLAQSQNFQSLLKDACRQAWVVYAKRPFAGPETVLAYLSRYTHRVGITNRRLLNLDTEEKTVAFEYKDYADNSRKKVMTLPLDEFIRRFRLHILPERFVKIRHYGFLANRNRRERVAQARAALPPPPVLSDNKQESSVVTTKAATPQMVCPNCQKQTLVLMAIVHPAPRPHPAPDDSS